MFSPPDGTGDHGIIFENLKIYGNAVNQTRANPLISFTAVWNNLIMLLLRAVKGMELIFYLPIMCILIIAKFFIVNRKNSNNLRAWTLGAVVSVTTVADTGLSSGNFNVWQLTINTRANANARGNTTLGSTVKAGDVYTFIVWAKASSPTNIRLYIGDSSENDFTRRVFEIGTKWKPYAITHTFQTSGTNCVGKIFNLENANSSMTIRVLDTLIVKDWITSLPITTGTAQVTKSKSMFGVLPLTIPSG